MNRYNRGPTIGGPSKATASTLCQKCLKRDIYECKSGAQERPYVSRPSRTQQLLNPKLVPKLTNDAPQDLLRKKGIADEQLAKAKLERGRKRGQSEDLDGLPPKKLRSLSTSSTPSSISTISTSKSKSPTPQREPRRAGNSFRSESPMPSHARAHTSAYLRSPPRLTDSEKKKRRRSFSSEGSLSPEYGQSRRDRAGSRSTRRRYKQESPPIRGRRSESRSPPPRTRRRMSDDRPNVKRDTHNEPLGRKENIAPTRERSLSPFSKRLALTQAMNMGSR